MPRRHRAWLLLVALAPFLAGAAAAPPARSEAPSTPAGAGRKVRLFNIPALPLHQALEQFSVVTGSAVMYNSHLADNRRSNPVIGLFTTEVALRMLLEGSDLTIRYTSPTDFMLVNAAQAKAEEQAKGVAGTGEAAGASLVLGTLYVDVPPGTGQRPDFSLYGQAMRSELKRSLARSPDTANRIYQVQLDVWVNHLGRLRYPRMVKSTGRPELDESIRRVVEATTVKDPPPKGLPQPVRITIIAL